MDAKALPVTVISGFLGSGKTSLLKYILKSKKSDYRVALIVNEITSVNMDVVAIEGAKLLQSNEKMVEMSNGCICCTLRLDLVKQLQELYAMGCFDAVVIESSGIADPMEVAETFFIDLNTTTADGEPVAAGGNGSMKGQGACSFLQDVTPLDCCVSVVDASTLLQFVHSTQESSTLREKEIQNSSSTSVAAQDSAEGAVPISELLFSQLDFANVIVANKMDLLESDDKRAEVLQFLRVLNKKAAIISCTYGEVPLEKILRTGLFNEAFAKSVNDKWLKDEANSDVPHVSETALYQLSTCTFYVEVPFHPTRLHNWMETYFVINEAKMVPDSSTSAGSSSETVNSDQSWRKHEAVREARRRERYGDLFRGKGTAWLGNPKRDDVFASWSQCGSILTFCSGGYWEEHPQFGNKNFNRHQQLVFIGQKLKEEVLLGDLRELLLTTAELGQLERALRRDSADNVFLDPFIKFFDSDDESDEEEDEEESSEEYQPDSKRRRQ